jgi:hypothetical protein
VLIDSGNLPGPGHIIPRCRVAAGVRGLDGGAVADFREALTSVIPHQMPAPARPASPLMLYPKDR